MFSSPILHFFFPDPIIYGTETAKYTTRGISCILLFFICFIDKSGVSIGKPNL